MSDQLVTILGGLVLSVGYTFASVAVAGKAEKMRKDWSTWLVCSFLLTPLVCWFLVGVVGGKKSRKAKPSVISHHTRPIQLLPCHECGRTIGSTSKMCRFCGASRHESDNELVVNGVSHGANHGLGQPVAQGSQTHYSA
ncbi:hypothetical protein [Sulfuriroseicoccus oceanibius]|uniref:Uncharacterized protein n=1 Tax=Sulfuriroseicoccus oceanibius TaxID=2707525 RepID=A0A6B3L235_9BACT|nr:hypothetical protein [Sulfuriroseicoccus oceanibius]QQL43766.1 hypothetical protein G3M56_007585 [Sulfuriroseicoccus oceanibius]